MLRATVYLLKIYVSSKVFICFWYVLIYIALKLSFLYKNANPRPPMYCWLVGHFPSPLLSLFFCLQMARLIIRWWWWWRRHGHRTEDSFNVTVCATFSSVSIADIIFVSVSIESAKQENHTDVYAGWYTLRHIFSLIDEKFILVVERKNMLSFCVNLK